MLVTGENIDGNTVQKTILLPLGLQGAGQERLSLAGLEVRIEDGKVIVDNIVFGSAAQEAGLDFDWQILNIQTEAERPPKQLMFIPAILLLLLVGFVQRSRRSQPETLSNVLKRYYYLLIYKRLTWHPKRSKLQ